ncbi:MAG: glycosyltransferase family 4 protein [Faecalimonas sp.]|nr:glycosyltransferase family 4 protein [Faecalimonas sp.]
MKKICFVTTVSITLKVFVLKTAEYIHQNTDWDISMICSSDDEFAASLPEYIHYIPVHMERGISIGGVKAMLEMLRIFKKERFDLVQYSTPNASLYAALAGKLCKIPVRLYCQWGIAYVGFTGLKRKIFKMIEKIVCRLSTWVEPDSKSNLAFAHNEGLYPKEKGSVIGNGSACGVDLKKFDVSKRAQYREEIRSKYGLTEDAFVFGYVGRITRDKGINELLQAFQELQENHTNSCLMLVGPDECDATVDAALYQWSKENVNVIYTGYTNVVEQYVSAMDVYLLPSYREGFGMGVVEAEAMGVPVIVTDIPGPTDAMLDGETGIVVPKKSTSALQAAMQRMLEEEEFRTLCSANATKLVIENFEQQAFMKEVLEDRKRLLS